MSHDSHAIATIEVPTWITAKAVARGIRANEVRRTSKRRRFIDPVTCDRDYAIAEQEFMMAMQAYKQSSGRMHPTCSEILEVLAGLGYEKPGAAA